MSKQSGQDYIKGLALIGVVSVPREDLAQRSENPKEYFELIRLTKAIGLLVAGKLSEKQRARLGIKSQNHYRWECRS